jgi:hypothetical protein
MVWFGLKSRLVVAAAIRKGTLVSSVQVDGSLPVGGALMTLASYETR